MARDITGVNDPYHTPARAIRPTIVKRRESVDVAMSASGAMCNLFIISVKEVMRRAIGAVCLLFVRSRSFDTCYTGLKVNTAT